MSMAIKAKPEGKKEIIRKLLHIYGWAMWQMPVYPASLKEQQK